jgi:6-phosphogluconolactonase
MSTHNQGQMATGHEVVIFESREDLTAAASERVVAAAAEAIAARGRFRILLAGGSTPRALYSALAADERPQWEQWELFWGDERCVPPGDDESNYAMVRATLLEPLLQRGRTPGRVARFQSELPPGDAAAHYNALLREVAAAQSAAEDAGDSTQDGRIPRFDVALLGMGADGHTASLFPQSAALGESSRLAVANPVPQLGVTRLTVTYPVLNAARQILFLVVGEDKAPALADVLEGEPDPQRLPSQLVAPSDGRLLWLVDAAAALLLHPAQL